MKAATGSEVSSTPEGRGSHAQTSYAKGHTTWLAGLVVPALFAASGAAALALEIVWTRWLTLAVGSSMYATTIVLATFMGGIGIGSWLAGRIADRDPQRCMLWFSAAETAIALWSLASIVVVARGLPALAAMLARLLDLESLPGWSRVTLAVMALLPPTVLMGATLPWLVRWASWSGMLPGRGVGVLYSANTLGGVAGILVATFVLVERFGLATTVVFAGAADLTVGLIALAVWRYTLARPEPEQVLNETRRSGTAAGPFRGVMFGVTLGYFVSGFVGLGLEVTTHRILAVLVGSSVYAFAVMLAAFLLGIAAGGALAAGLGATRWNPALLLGLTLGGLAIGATLSLRMATMSGWGVAGRIARTLPVLGGWSYTFELAGYLVTLLPATLMLGAAVPLVGRVAADHGKLGRGFGTAYAWNTLGAVLGSTVVGVGMIPVLGTARSTLVLAVIAGAGGLVVVATAVPRHSRVMPVAAVAVLLSAAVGLGWGVNPVRDNMAELSQKISGLKRELFFREGPVQTVTVLHVDDDHVLEYYQILTNRLSLTATALYARRYMELLGHLPVLWSHTPRRALVIGFGTGITSSAVVSHPQLETVVIAEISPEIGEASHLFREANRDVLLDPRVRFRLEDGRHLLLASQQPWDVITLEPPPPRVSGVVSLYTRDFYELCRQRLAPGGIVAQWIPLHSQSADEIWMLVRSFLEGMPHVLGFLPVARDLILIGGNAPLEVDLQVLSARMALPSVANSLAAIGFNEPVDVLAATMANRETLEELTVHVLPVTDDRPRVEYFARFGKNPPLTRVDGLTQRPVPVEQLVRGSVSSIERQRFHTARQALFAILQAAWEREAGRDDEAQALVDRAVDLRPNDAYYLWEARLSDEHIQRLADRVTQGEATLETWMNLGVKLVRRGEYERGITALRHGQEIAPDNPEVVLRLGLALIRYDDESNDEELRAALQRFLRLAPTHPRAESIRRYLADYQPQVR